ncbi:MAG: hypothetical protein LBD23_01700 [Oscillospiraceae bacterium]|nr:hypothetical protein [Oscillospiraceae bacterium]
MRKKQKILTTLILILLILLGSVITVFADTGIESGLVEIEDNPIPLSTLNNTSRLTGTILLLVIGGTIIITAGIVLVLYRN